jgi:membrane-bound lytic murein transglycosylase B
MWKGKSAVLAGLLAAAMASNSSANAAQCGAGPAGFVAWKRAFADEARTHGIGAKGVAALLGTTYSVGTIRADRGQKSFKLSLSAFMAKRGAATIVARGRSLKRANGALFASIERRFGVPPGPLLAIWGMETGFGNSTGNQNTLSAVATLAYDCRRPQYFTEHLYAAQVS